MKTGDVIQKIDGAPLANASRLSDTVSEKKPGDAMVLTLLRGGKSEEALALVRGSPLADVATEPFAAPEVARLEELELSAREAATRSER